MICITVQGLIQFIVIWLVFKYNFREIIMKDKLVFIIVPGTFNLIVTTFYAV